MFVRDVAGPDRRLRYRRQARPSGRPEPDHLMETSPLLTVLRLLHIVGGVYWAGTMFFFVTFLEPSLRSLGPDGGKVMTRMFERGYLTLIPAVALVTVLSGLWLLWIVSGGFDSAWMGTSVGIGFSTGGLFAIIALLAGLIVMRPAASRIWDIARALPAADETQRTALTAEMTTLRGRTALLGRVILVLLLLSVALMAVARYL